MSGETDILFEVMTPLGFQVRVTRTSWKLIIDVKHPAMAGREEDVRKALEDPDEIRQSKSDKNVYLFYKSERKAMDLCWFQANRHARLLNHDLSYRCDQGRSTGMAQVKVYYDHEGNTLTVWFGNPDDEYIAEETGEEIVLMKDRDGKVIGFEKLNFTTGESNDALRVAFETVSS